MFEGAKPMLMTPVMTPQYVVDRVWRAMKRGKPRLIMPWTVYLSNALKGLLPIGLFDWMADHIFGVYHSMDERSEEHTSELQSLMRISYAVFCLKKKTT